MTIMPLARRPRPRPGTCPDGPERGAREIEIWTTARLGREAFFARFDQRLELAVGLTDRLMTAVYETEAETGVEVDLAATWLVRPGLTAGLEARNVKEIVDGEWE
jgi:hypothetical protein